MERRPDLAERMDDPSCDLATLHRTYAQFAPLNQLVAGWADGWRRVVQPAVRRAVDARGHARILDVGCGGGDLARRLAGWASASDLTVEIVGIDPDPRALAYARRRSTPPNVHYERRELHEVADSEVRFDVAISNHVLHHLPEDDLASFLAASRAVAREAVLHSDLHRSRWALPAFGVLSLPFRGSYIREDGFTSIHRAWRAEELGPHLPDGLRAVQAGTFRLWVTGGPRT